MDVFEKDYNLEDTQNAESKVVDDLVVSETVNEEQQSSNSESLEETNPHQGLVSEKLDALDSVGETEPSLDLTKPVHEFSEEAKEEDQVEHTDVGNKTEQSLDESNGVSINSVVSIGIDLSSSGRNGDVSPILTNVVPKGIEQDMIENKNNEEATEETTMLPASDENPEESSNAASDLVSNQNLANVLQSEDRKDSNVSELPESTENQHFIAVTPREEIESQQLDLLREDVDGHIFKVASKKEIDSIEQGNRVSVTLLDVETSENKCIGFIQKLNGRYMLGWNEVLQMRNINAGDLIGLQYASSSNTFKFILVNKVQRLAI
ncbi:unnamed protein product [Camellia sinensis]